MAFKTVKLSVSITEQQKERWDEYAEKSSMSTSEFVRKAVESYISALERAVSKRNGGR